MAAPKKTGLCTYRNIRIDDEVLPLAIAAAALARITVQDFISDVVNIAASRELDRKPITRRPSPPKPRGPGRPKKTQE